MDGYALYALQWCGFGLGHSLLTTPGVKSLLGKITGRGYRLVYNIISMIHLWFVMRFGHAHLSTNHLSLFESTYLLWMMAIVSVTGCFIIVWALSLYDLGEFSGVSQIRASSRNLAHNGTLKTEGLLSWVRHPLYLGGLLVLWGRATSELGLLTAGFATLYLCVGIYFEEKKLVRLWGQEYQDYRERVSMLLPIKRLFRATR